MISINLYLILMKPGAPSGFGRMLTRPVVVGIYLSLFLTKLKSIPICLLFGWYIGFAKRYKTPKLSHTHTIE